MSFRKEIKYSYSINEIKLVKEFLLKKGMKNLFPRRVINSCYFDTTDYELYRISIEDSLPKKKIRIRWYEKNNKFLKEIKITSIEGRYKNSQPYFFDDIYINSSHKLFDNDYGLLKPSLLVSYEREYYSYEKVRITFDQKIKYKSYRNTKKKSAKDNLCVLEIKADINQSDDYLHNVINKLPDCFSKYTRGISFVNNEI